MNRDDIIKMAAEGRITVEDAARAVRVALVFGGSDYNLAAMNAQSMVAHLRESPHYEAFRDLIVLPKETQ